MMISEQNFKTVLDALWATYANSTSLINTLEAVGLLVDDNKHEYPSVCFATPGFRGLYTMSSKVSNTLLQIMGINPEAPGSNDRQTILEELDDFLHDVKATYPDDFDKFPESCYNHLLEIFKVSGGIKLPWTKRDEKRMNGRSIGGAYWNEKLFGNFNDRSDIQLRDEGYAQYEVKLSNKGSIAIWAHTEDEARELGNNLTKYEVNAYAYFDSAIVTDVYECARFDGVF